MALLSLYPISAIPYTHDASATLMSGTRVLYSYEEEKLSRFQYAIAEFPEKAAVVAFQQTGIRPSDVERLVVTSIENCSARADFTARIQFAKDLFCLLPTTEVTCVPHHLAHSALAVLTSPFDDCVFLTMDGGGDFSMGHWGIFREGAFEIFEEFQFSPALVFLYLTTLAGFSAFDEGKLMGLSAFGQVDSHFLEWLQAHFWIREGGASLEIAPDIGLKWLNSSFRPDAVDPGSLRRSKYAPKGVDFVCSGGLDWASRVSPADIAATGQRFFEQLITRAVKNIREISGTSHFALSGGAFQNVVVNGKLHTEASILPHVPVAPHDAGLSLGAALLTDFNIKGRRQDGNSSPYLGPKFRDTSIVPLLRVPLLAI